MFDFSAKSKSNSMIFDSVDSSLSPLSENIRLPNFYHRFIVQFDEIRRDHQEFPLLPMDSTLIYHYTPQFVN